MLRMHAATLRLIQIKPVRLMTSKRLNAFAQNIKYLTLDKKKVGVP